MILLVLPIQSLKATVECSNDKNPANFDEVQRFRTAFPFLSSFEEIFSVYSNDGTYIGEVNCEKKSGYLIKQGWGEMRWANGTLYGPNDVFYYSNGDRYYGQWNMDLQEGNFLVISIRGHP